MLDETFEPREGVEPDVHGWLSTGEVPSSSTARIWISPERARWAREDRRVVEELSDGAVVVERTFASHDWLVPRGPEGGGRRRGPRARGRPHRRARGGRGARRRRQALSARPAPAADAPCGAPATGSSSPPSALVPAGYPAAPTVPSRREQIQMSDDELRAFLEEQMVMQCATVGPQGLPHMVPLWFVADGRRR